MTSQEEKKQAAERVREAVENLNTALSAAASIGLRVEP